MTPRIQDFKFRDYVRAARLEHLVQTRDLPGIGRIGAIYLDPAWIETKHWFPITNDAATAHDFFGAFNRGKTDYLYTSEMFQQLAARAHELAVEPDYDHAFALGSHANYWHFVMDFIPKLYFLFKDGNPSLPLLVGPDFGASQLSILEHVYKANNQPPPRIIRMPEGIAPVRRTFFPGFLSMAAGPSLGSAALSAALWNYFLPLPETRPAERRFFVQRGAVTQRRLLNEADIAFYLAQRGFEVINPGNFSFSQQIDIFRTAKFVIAPHGAALTNIVFAPPGGTLVEMIVGRDQPFFAKLAQAKQWRRIVIRDTKTPEDASHNQDMEIPLSAVEKVVTELGL